MENCINSKVQKLLTKKGKRTVTENARKEEKVYDRLFYCLDTLYFCGWMRRDAMRNIRRNLIKQLNGIV